VIFRIKRFDPDSGRRASWRAYTVDARPRMSVLDGLFWILEHADGTLGFRYSCRAGMCGSCAMVINGREDLACRRRLDQMASPVHVEPLRSLPVIKDLVVDMTAFFAKYKAVDPFYVGEDPTMTGPRYAGLSADVRDARGDDRAGLVLGEGGVFACHDAGNCVAACPVGIQPLLSIRLLRKRAARA